MVQQTGKKKQRTCVTCGKQDAKMGLHRVVRLAAGGADFDPTGRVAGRGAYVCSVECFAAARKTGKIDRALRTKLDEESYERIAAGLSQALREA